MKESEMTLRDLIKHFDKWQKKHKLNMPSIRVEKSLWDDSDEEKVMITLYEEQPQAGRKNKIAIAADQKLSKLNLKVMELKLLAEHAEQVSDQS